MRIVEKSGKWYAQISIKMPTRESQGEHTLGVDLGLKVPAVAVISTGKTRFFGNGRMNKHMKRQYRNKRTRLGKAKKLKAIRKLNNKEQR